MPALLKILLTLAVILLVLAALLFIGMRIQPKPFAPVPLPAGPVETIPLPDGLPAPVERFYRTVYGDQIPVVESVVVSGSGKARPFGPFYFPVRFRFSHITGQSYRHYIELTLFGLPIARVNERYLDGVSRFQAPVGPVEENEPKTNQGANLGMWSESIWFPSVFLTDERVRWEPVDGVTALLRVPFEEGEETYVVRFDEETGLITYFESMRYHAASSTAKTLWLNESVEWGEVGGQLVLKTGAAIWLDQREPWATFTVEDMVYNADLSEYITAEGK